MCMHVSSEHHTYHSHEASFPGAYTHILLDILKINDLKTTNRDRKKANKQDIRYCSIDSNGQYNIQLPL